LRTIDKGITDEKKWNDDDGGFFVVEESSHILREGKKPDLKPQNPSQPHERKCNQVIEAADG